MDEASTILSGTPANRLADLAARRTAGHLTPLEALALCVLTGGREGEEAVPALLDEAMAVYHHGGYRVPVRVVADWDRTQVIVTTPEWLPPDEANQLARTLAKELHEPHGTVKVIVVGAGCKVDVYETAAK
jgi:hypothetical protein